jgi:hypothetical protein
MELNTGSGKTGHEKGGSGTVKQDNPRGRSLSGPKLSVDAVSNVPLEATFLWKQRSFGSNVPLDQ